MKAHHPTSHLNMEANLPFVPLFEACIALRTAADASAGTYRFLHARP